MGMNITSRIHLKKFYLIITALVMITTTLTGCGKATVLELSGTIESTQLEACSEVTGKVVDLQKNEGDTIKKGDTLAVLDSSMQELAVKQQEAVVSLKEAKLEELKAGTRPQQLDQAKAAVTSAELSATNASTSVKNAQTTYDYWLDKYEKIKELYNTGTATDSDLSDAKYKVDTAKQQLDIAGKQLSSSREQLKSSKAQLDLLKTGSTTQTIDAANADLEQSRIALEQANLTLSKYSVKAPADGQYSLRNVNIGDLINTGASVATITVTDDLWVNIFVPQKYLALINNSQELDLRVNALNNGIVKGRIVRIADKAEFTPKNTETDEAKENTVFKVKVAIIENTDRLKAGMTLDALIPLE